MSDILMLAWMLFVDVVLLFVLILLVKSFRGNWAHYRALQADRKT